MSQSDPPTIAELEPLRLGRELAALRALCNTAGEPLGLCRGPEHMLVFANAALRSTLDQALPEGRRLREGAPALADGALHVGLDRVFGGGRLERVALEAGLVLELVPLFDARCEVVGVLITAGGGHESRAARFRALDLREAGLRRRELALQAREEAQARRWRLDDELEPVDAQVLGVIAHELRTPVHAILGFGSLLERELGAGGGDHLLRMLGAAEVLRQRVEDLLDLGQLEAGLFEVTLRPVGFGEMLASALEGVRQRAELKGLHVVEELPAGLPAVLADPDKLGRALDKLLDNAVKFTPAGGTITVRAWAGRDFVDCEIDDTGVGIAAADLPHVFDAFGRLDATLARHASGCGIGLALGRGYVEAQGGALTIASTEGRGTTCRVAMPRSA